jgi:hypothetical protein
MLEELINTSIRNVPVPVHKALHVIAGVRSKTYNEVANEALRRFVLDERTALKLELEVIDTVR